MKSLAERERRELEDIDAALERLRSGTFGRCQRCGGTLTMQRIDAVPEVRHCMRCENRRGGDR
jgi:DnaK suppressor protein